MNIVERSFNEFFKVTYFSKKCKSGERRNREAAGVHNGYRCTVLFLSEKSNNYSHVNVLTKYLFIMGEAIMAGVTLIDSGQGKKNTMYTTGYLGNYSNTAQKKKIMHVLVLLSFSPFFNRQPY